MKTNILKPIRWWALVLCCVLLSAARAQDVETPAAGKDATVQAPDRATGDAQQGAGSQKGGDAPQDDRSQHDAPPDDDASRTPSPSDEDDEWTSQADSGSVGSHGHRHRHHDGDGDAVVSIGHKAELLAGEHAESVVAVFGSATSAGDVDNSVVSILGRTHVTGKVGDAVVAVMGSVYVNSEVDGDVVSVLGNVELGPEARVRGNIVIVGGELTRDPAATIGGHVQTVFSTDWEGFDWLRPWIERCLLYGRPLAFAPGLGWAWGIALGMLALYVFIAVLFRSAVEHCVRTLESKPGLSILAALLTVLLIPVLLVLLLITVLGIAAIPFLGIGLLCAAIFGKVVVLASIGRRCTPMLANDPVMHTVVGVVVGGAIVLVLYTIPVFGFLVQKLLEALGLGAVIYTMLIAVRSGWQARTAARNGGQGPSAGPGGGVGAGGVAGPGGGVGPGGVGGPGGGVGLGAGAGSIGGAAQAAGFSGTVGAGGADAEAAAASSGAASNHRPAFGDFNARSEPPPGGSASSSSTANPNSTGGGPNSTAGGFTSSAPPGSTGPTASIASLPRAGFFIRMGALLLDAILIGIVLHQIYEGPRMELLALAAYGAVMWKLKASTIGGIICGLKVVRLDGRPIDWPTAIVRALSCFLSLAVVGLGFLWIAIDSERQAWHDKIAGTVVVRAPKGVSLL
jgi:uncharacterized RDD family membrane protein YckC